MPGHENGRPRDGVDELNEANFKLTEIAKLGIVVAN
jgi:hypothetical protein